MYVMFLTFFKNNNIIRNNIKNILFIIIKEVRDQILGLWVSQSLDGITWQKYMTVIRESIIKS